MNSGIYRIVNTVNKKTYVGQSDDFIERRKGHWTPLRGGYHHNGHLQSAWNKYGEASFIFEILELIEIPEGLSIVETREYLTPYEQAWMDKLHPEYNKTPAAGTTRGYKHTDESRAKMVGREVSAETRALIGANSTGRPVSEETRAKLRDINLGREVSQETREKLSITSTGRQARLGMPHTEETKAKISAANMGRVVSDETREKIREARKRQVNIPMKGGHHTDETKAKISAANTGRVLTPETRARQSIASTGRRLSDEAKAKIGTKAKDRHAAKLFAREIAKIGCLLG